MHRIWIALGSLAGLSGVAMAAYAAHGLPGRLTPDALEMVRSGAQMQLWHALALVLCGVWAAGRGGALADWAGAAFVLGIEAAKTAAAGEMVGKGVTVAVAMMAREILVQGMFERVHDLSDMSYIAVLRYI